MGAVIELLEAVASWESLLLVIAAFGFAPGFILRLLVRIYPRDDPRRQELVAELYTVRRIERPLFVAEQLETVLFEGLPHRARSLWSSTRKRASRVRAWLDNGGIWKLASWVAAAAGTADFVVNKSAELMVVGFSILIGGYILKFILRRRQTADRRRYVTELRREHENDHRVRYLYVNQAEALYVASKSIAANERLVVIGPAAAGKTTLLKMLTTSFITGPIAEPEFIPVTVAIRGWQAECMPFRELIIQEVARKSGLSLKRARTFVDSQKIVALIDALDENIASNPSHILSAINHGWAGRPYVLTSRPLDQAMEWADTCTYSFESFWSPVTESKADRENP